MKPLLLSLFLPIIFLSSFAQTLPTRTEVLKIIDHINHQVPPDGKTDVEINYKEPFKYIMAKFMGLPTKECLIIVPALSFGWRPSDYVMHFNKSDTPPNWENDYSYISKHLPFCGEKADTIDISPFDGIKELTFQYESLNRGYYGKEFKIISLKSGNESKLYSFRSFMIPGDEYSVDMAIGDSIYCPYSIKVKDINNDRIKEIIESKRVGLLLKKVKSADENYWHLKVNENTYLTIYSYENGVFYGTKPIVIHTKTGDSDELSDLEEIMNDHL